MFNSFNPFNLFNASVVLATLLLGTTISSSQADTAPLYENSGIFLCPPFVPPQIDAVTFLNDPASQLIIDFTNLINFTPPPLITAPYEMQNTLNFTNSINAVLGSSSGFRFNTYNPHAGAASDPRHRASTFYNAGDIESATTNTFSILAIPNFAVFNTGLGGVQTIIDATNILNPGSIFSGYESLLSMRGNTIDLTRSTIAMETSPFTIFGGIIFGFGFGTFGADGYWGLGLSTLKFPCVAPNTVYRFDPCAFFSFSPYTTPEHLVTNRDYTVSCTFLDPPNTLSYLSDVTDPFTNIRLVRAVFVGNTNLSITPTVYLNSFFADAIVSFALPQTNADLSLSTNYLYFLDSLDSNPDLGPPNFGLNFNGFAGTAGVRPTFIPQNYEVFSGLIPDFFLGTPSPVTTIPSGTFICGNATNEYTAYQSVLSPTSRLVTDVAHQDYTNMPGRIEISADDYLDLSDSSISSLNYLRIEATNHFAGAGQAQISSPWAGFNLRSTNGLLAFTNVFLPYAYRPEGFCNLYSALWTNVIGSNPGFTNIFHVFFVDANFAGAVPSRVEDLVLRSTNVLGGDDNLIIGDALTVTRSLLLDSQRLTIITNGPDNITPHGLLNITDARILWPNSTPRLQYLTNYGSIGAVNTVFFGGGRNSPYVTNSLNEPYVEFINGGGITNFGSRIRARDFQNGGGFVAEGGTFTLDDCQRALLLNGVCTASNGAVSLNANNLLDSNHLLVAGAGLTLAVTNILSDGVPNLAILPASDQLTATVTNGNTWQTSYGLNLLVAPAGGGDLLGTMISSHASTNRIIPNVWAGRDVGPVNDGFFNNAALGGLVLDGSPRSLFRFSGTGGANALYVDRLELRNSAVLQNSSGFLIGVTNLPNMRIYYGQAVMTDGLTYTNDVSEDLDFVYSTTPRPGGPRHEFYWLRDYNYGYFSSTNVVAFGVTNRLNTARVTSRTLPPITSITPWTPSGTDVPELPAPPPPPSSSTTGSTGTNDPPGSTNSIAALPKLGQPPSSALSQPAATAFALAQGSYAGLFSDTNGVAAPSSGYFSAKTTAAGRYSGKLLLAGKSYSFSGTFDASGSAHNLIPRGSILRALQLDLHFDMSASGEITGQLTDSHWTAQIFAQLQPAAKRLPVNYTMVIPHESSAGTPAGDGFGTIKVSAKNSLQFSGLLADGAKLSQSSAVSKQGYWPLYVCLYGGSGCLIGWQQFADAPQSDLSGQVLWVKPAGLDAKYARSYLAGFTNDVETLGSIFTKPNSGARSLGSGDFSRMYSLSLSGGGLSSPISDAFTLGLNNRISSSSDPKLSLSVNTTSGLFSGKTINPQTGALFPFQGVLMEKNHSGAGFFLDPVLNLSGQVYLGAP
jgi:hypothetical protein